MSRSEPFPTNPARRARSPPVPTDVANITLPLSISRAPSRPMTPSSSTSGTAYSTRGSPARPQRSDLRPRQASQYSQTSTYRDSVSSSPSDAPTGSVRLRERQERPRPNGVRDDTETSPTALTAALNAFQTAGRKRAMTNGSVDREREREREQAIHDEAQRQRRIRERAPGRRTNGNVKTAGSFDAVLDRIQDDWAFVIDPDFNPVDLSLQLLDSSSTGKDIDSFRRTKDMLTRALKGSVDKHYQAFAAALPHHASLLSHLIEAQTRTLEARTALQEARDALGNRRPDLVQLWSRGQTIEEMLRILDQIEHLKSIPDALESLISEKQLLQAAVLLLQSLKMIDRQDMLEIGAVADLRSYLKGQENALKDILLDELHSHLYLKSFWCETRWASYVPNERQLPLTDYDKDVPQSLDSNQSPSLSNSGCPPRLRRYLNSLAVRPNDPPHDLNNAEFNMRSSYSIPQSLSVAASLASRGKGEEPKNLEADSFGYIETLLEALAVLGRLGNGLDIIAQRLPSEIYSLVDSTLEEVGERAEISRRMSAFIPGANARISDVAIDVATLRLAALESSDRHADHEILRDLFWTLYSKFDAVAQSLRVVYEVSNRIGARRDFKDSSGLKLGSLFPLNELWSPIQAEVRTLLNDYLLDDEKGSAVGRNPISSINEVLREARFTRNWGKQVFKFVDTDTKATSKTLREHEHELNQVLRDTVPGLVQGSLDSTVQASQSTLGTDDRLIEAEHHRLLVRSDPFYVSVLFQPTLAFLERVAEVLPSGQELTRPSTALMDEFVLNVYLPQLEAKVSLLFHQAVTGQDAFQVDQTALRLSPQPLLRGFTQLMALINSLCSMLRTTPVHRENYARLILSVVIQFYQRCSDRFHFIVARSSADTSDIRLLRPAQLAQQADISACLAELYRALDDELRSQKISEQETRIEMGILEASSEHIVKEDLLDAARDIPLLSNLYHSLMWFVRQLNNLKVLVDDTQTSNTPYPPNLPLPLLSSSAEMLQLPLSRDMALRCDALLKTYEQLAELILYTIRIDVRCRTVYYLSAAMRHGNYRMGQEDGEPDPHVIDLNSELSKVDESVSISLPDKERHFVFAGLELLMEGVLVSYARYIRVANSYGITKITRNIMAVRQYTKTMTSCSADYEFTRAKKYFNLFYAGPEALLEGIRQGKSFTFDQYRAMLSLQCGVDQSQGQAGVAQATDKNYNRYVIDLHGLELEHSGDDS